MDVTNICFLLDQKIASEILFPIKFERVEVYLWGLHLTWNKEFLVPGTNANESKLKHSLLHIC